MWFTTMSPFGCSAVCLLYSSCYFPCALSCLLFAALQAATFESVNRVSTVFSVLGGIVRQNLNIQSSAHLKTDEKWMNEGGAHPAKSEPTVNVGGVDSDCIFGFLDEISIEAPHAAFLLTFVKCISLLKAHVGIVQTPELKSQLCDQRDGFVNDVSVFSVF